MKVVIITVSIIFSSLVSAQPNSSDIEKRLNKIEQFLSLSDLELVQCTINSSLVGIEGNLEFLGVAASQSTALVNLSKDCERKTDGNTKCTSVSLMRDPDFGGDATCVSISAKEYFKN